MKLCSWGILSSQNRLDLRFEPFRATIGADMINQMDRDQMASTMLHKVIIIGYECQTMIKNANIVNINL